MRAAVVSSFGPASAVQLCEVPRPEPGPGEVRVRVRACSLNYSDLLQRAGEYRAGPRPPFVSGVEAAGVVEPGGERVALIANGGCHAESVVVPRDRCIPIPAGLSFEAAAAFPVSYLTAYQGLVHGARAEPGDHVMVLAAGGSLGTAAVQIAVRLGCHVLAVASSARNQKLALELGANAAFGYEEIRNHRADVLLDGVGGREGQRALRALRPLGRAILVGCASRDPRPLDSIGLIFSSLTAVGVHLHSIAERPDRVREATGHILPWIEREALRIQVGHVLPLEKIAQAHALLASREHSGKIVLTP